MGGILGLSPSCTGLGPLGSWAGLHPLQPLSPAAFAPFVPCQSSPWVDPCTPGLTTGCRTTRPLYVPALPPGGCLLHGSGTCEWPVPSGQCPGEGQRPERSEHGFLSIVRCPGCPLTLSSHTRPSFNLGQNAPPSWAECVYLCDSRRPGLVQGSSSRAGVGSLPDLYTGPDLSVH